jgi:5-methylthioadenosine/S-adenosylhomocysteine deaminase
VIHVGWSILFFCLCAVAWPQSTPIALTGTILTPDGPVPNGTVLIRDGKIVAAGTSISLPTGVKTIATNGILVPGFVDLHNHLTWNVFPRWKSIEEFGSRYDWQQKPVYKVLMDAPHRALVEEGYECEMERYAEIKAVSEGETSVVGGTAQDCGPRLARNLDINHGAQDHHIIYNVFPFQMTEAALESAKNALDHNGALLIHVAEGAPNDASAAREFAMLKGRGLLRQGVSIIHGVALKPADFTEMASAGVGFIWSPHSNLELYGGTADVRAAKAAGVKMALAPDWSPTGSDGLLAELNYAATWNASQEHPVFTDRELVEMATSRAAQLAGMGDRLGRIAPGYLADLLVLQPHGLATHQDPYWIVVHSDARDVALVMIDGKAVYGDSSLTSQFPLPSAMDRVTVCGQTKSIVPQESNGTQVHFASIETKLEKALSEWGRKLAPLAECGQ